MINASYGGQSYTDVSTLVASDGTNSATVTLTETGVIPTPTATKSITSNGTNIDVTNYAAVDVAVPGGSGSSMLSGSFTPAENIETYVISALAGTTLEHIFIKIVGDLDQSLLGNSTRSVSCAYFDYDATNPSYFMIPSSGAGSAMAAPRHTNNASGEANLVLFDRTTGTITVYGTKTNSGYLVGGKTYEWWAW